jgi:hypothetical protein
MSDVERRFAARGYGSNRVWHWVHRIEPHIVVPKCWTEPFEWCRASRPDTDFKITLDPGDTLCPTCGGWDGLVTPVP